MSTIRLGIYEKALVSAPWPEFFGQVRAGGFHFVDLSVDETPERAARLDWSQEERRSVRDAARAAGVQIGGICLSLHRRIMPGSADPAVRAQARDVYRKGIDLAHDLGVSVVQVAGYYAYYEDDDPESRSRYIDTLKDAVPHAAHRGVILAIENVDGHDISSVQDAMSVVHECASPWVQIYPDVGNIAEHGGDATEELAAGRGHMVALHVKDVLPGEPRRIFFGTGVADFDAAFAELKRQDWDGRIMLEMWNDDSPDSPATCERARRFIEEKLISAGCTVQPLQ
ncbi:L-ribulose-5-phosphate 3-epimerase [Corynebacterium sp. P7202]|uniref:L-ribulose-5-phosphate 3-epimerase n=1 Tax=Corynebacterium pygosceleis TaxID=2800406 RepID=A0A9Q4C5Y0_9CORY|nr:L-ribulose-5-phosphate 3-epimerase [Corynebacterium pygosceleis]MCK7636826.1 L-ribulose-5-phosphate 3-epimerase [Corynebacterium pygosceleis]MCX7467579.1 L-ribulose-5-phosphate 3-epimerase [Corynebacterium pygosceleis]